MLMRTSCASDYAPFAQLARSACKQRACAPFYHQLSADAPSLPICKKKGIDCDTDNCLSAPYPLPICSDNLIFVPLRTLRRV